MEIIKSFIVKKIHADDNILDMTTKASGFGVAPQKRRREEKNCWV